MLADGIRFGAAICVDALAFVLWNLTARSPARVVRDVAAALRAPARLAAGLFWTGVGALLLTGSGVLVLTLALHVHEFLLLETLALVAGLAVDQLVGLELRRTLKP